MDQFKNLDVSASGIRANREWMEVISSNIANSKTTKTPDGGPYKGKIVSFAETLNTVNQQNPNVSKGAGVKVASVTPDESPFISLYYPSHPDANKEGYVLFPNVNPMQEMANMVMATRSYEANVSAFSTSKNMYLKALEIGR
ncbi:MAG: flagellar basal body rod protein FlgC [Elusimicrobiota bacterium]